MNGRRPYIPSMPSTWWLQRPSYLRYMLRELTCVWIGAYVVTLIIGLYRLGQGPEAWTGYLAALASTPGVVFQFLVLMFALYHMVSWFKLAPSTMPVWRNGQQVPPARIRLIHYIVWIGVSAFIIWLAVM